MKGGIVTAILALRALEQAGLVLAGDILVQSVVDEETGGPGTIAALERGYVADAGICLEPTDLRLLPVEGGLEWLRLIVRGIAGHSALRYRSVHAGGGAPAINAIEKAVILLQAVQRLEREWGIRKRHPLLPAGITTINPGVMLGGTGGGTDGMPQIVTSVSTFPDYCNLELSLKYLPNERIADVRAEFEAFIHHVAQTDPWLAEHPPEITWGIRGVSFPPAQTDPQHPLIQTLGAEVLAVMGVQPTISGFVAVSDIAWLSSAGIPCTLFGPGRADYAHALDERITIDEIAVGAEILARTITRWCGVVA
jgi:acetylornithine deacetylase